MIFQWNNRPIGDKILYKFNKDNSGYGALNDEWYIFFGVVPGVAGIL